MPSTKLLLPEEIMKLIDVAPNVKHRTTVMLSYSTGMRVSEIANWRTTRYGLYQYAHQNSAGHKDLLGHNSPKSTMKYIHLTPGV
jgi:hypothetical protein